MAEKKRKKNKIRDEPETHPHNKCGDSQIRAYIVIILQIFRQIKKNLLCFNYTSRPNCILSEHSIAKQNTKQKTG